MAKTRAACLLLLGGVCVGCTRPTVREKADAAPVASSAATPKPAAPPTSAKPAPHPGYVKMSVAGVAATDQGNAVLLVDSGRKRALLIFVGDGEAMSISLRLNQRSFRRPLTHDLFDSALDKLDVRIDSVQVDSLRNNTFHGTLVLKEGGRKISLDARPSDAIAMALGSGAPIHVARKVMERAGVDLDTLGDLALPDAGPPEKKPDRKSVEL